MEANTEVKEKEEQEQRRPAAGAGHHCQEVRLCIPDDTPVPDEQPPHEEQRYVLRQVPWWVREGNEHAYAPKYICIGPYHSGGGTGDRQLRRKELKRRYANELLEDAGEAHDHAAGRCCGLEQICRKKLQEMSGYIRGFYAGITLDKPTDDDLVEMMFLDGCFIIRHLYNYARSTSDDEELYQSTWAPAQLRNDLLLLENQIPFAVLVALFEHLAPRRIKLHGADEKTKRARLLDMALWYMLNQLWSLPAKKKPTEELGMAQDVAVDHLLHLLHEAHRAKLLRMHVAEQKCGGLVASCGRGCPILLMRMLRCLCLRGWGRWPIEEPDSRENIPSAAELTALGIRIKRVSPERGGFLDVRFGKDRVTLEIPSLHVAQTTTPVLQNLIAYEQQHVGGTDDKGKLKYPDDYFSTYAFLMYNLVSTREDITLLQKRCILHNNFGSDAKIIKYFKNLCMFNKRRGSNHIEHVLQDLRKCQQQKVYRDWAEVKNYINSPVKAFLLIISALVSLSTVLQALIAVRPAQQH